MAPFRDFLLPRDHLHVVVPWTPPEPAPHIAAEYERAMGDKIADVKRPRVFRYRYTDAVRTPDLIKLDKAVSEKVRDVLDKRWAALEAKAIAEIRANITGTPMEPTPEVRQTRKARELGMGYRSGAGSFDHPTDMYEYTAEAARSAYREQFWKAVADESKTPRFHGVGGSGLRPGERTPTETFDGYMKARAPVGSVAESPNERGFDMLWSEDLIRDTAEQPKVPTCRLWPVLALCAVLAALYAGALWAGLNLFEHRGF